MLDIYLNVAHEHEAKHAHSLELTKALSHLPVEELRELAETGDIKIASDWLEQFKGTEYLAKAIELEAESLQKEASIEVRVQQRLLEIKKGPEEKTAKASLKGYVSFVKANAHENIKGVKKLLSEKDEEKSHGKEKAASTEWADQVGRIFARNDMEKQALSAQAITTLGGAALGGLHGMFREGGGLGSGLVEGAGGAALGAGAHHLGTKAMAHAEYGPKIKDLKDRAVNFAKAKMPAAPEAAKTASEYELRKEAFGAALAQLGKAAIPAITGFIKKNPLKAGIAAVQTIGGGIQNKAQGGSFLGGAAGGAIGAAGTLAG